MSDLPEYFFRIRENGAAVFRVDSNNNHHRIEMEQIAVINTNRGDYKAQGEGVLSPSDVAAIESWLTARMDLLQQRALDDIHRAIDHLNLTAQWAQKNATDAELEDITDPLLLAMHDMRSVLVRKKSDRLIKSKDN